MITIKQKGDFKKTERLFSRAKNLRISSTLEKYGRLGVQRLANATPVRTGETASSWKYVVKKSQSGRWSLSWFNENENNGVSIAILLQYGHGTRGGTYVQGIDYINPAMKIVFEGFSDSIWKEVTSL